MFSYHKLILITLFNQNFSFMKRNIIILLLVAIFPLKAFNQISQGSIVVGGSLSLSVSKEKTEQDGDTEDGPTTSHFSLIPDVEYFFADNLSFGLGIGYSMDKTKTEGANMETISKEGTFLINPYVKKYFSLGDRAYFYGQAVLGLGFGKETNEVKAGTITTSVEENFNTLSLGIVPGFRFDVTEKIGLEAAIGYVGYVSNTFKSGSGNNEEKETVSSFQLNFIPNSLTLGIRYTFN